MLIVRKMTATEESWTSWLCDLGAEDYNNFVNHSDANEVDGSFPSLDCITPPTQDENLQQSFSTNSKGACSPFQTEHSTSTTSGEDKIFGERPAKTLKTGVSNSSLSYILSFDQNVNPAPIFNMDSTLKSKDKVVYHCKKGSLENQKKEPKHVIQANKNKNSGSVSRSLHHAKDHIIAERKRREKISQQFIALSALIPGLKKMDKATVLGDAINHVKQLQEQVKVLEEENKRKRVESVVYVEKSKVSSNEDVSDTSSNSGDGNSYDPSSKTNASVPEVEARVSEKHVLIRIHCQKQKGVFMNILKEIENRHLTVINSSILLFGTSKLDITIVAQMGDEFSESVKELARNIRVGLMQIM